MVFIDPDYQYGINANTEPLKRTRIGNMEITCTRDRKGKIIISASKIKTKKRKK